jgi:hypothetical protein
MAPVDHRETRVTGVLATEAQWPVPRLTAPGRTATLAQAAVPPWTQWRAIWSSSEALRRLSFFLICSR